MEYREEEVAAAEEVERPFYPESEKGECKVVQLEMWTSIKELF